MSMSSNTKADIKKMLEHYNRTLPRDPAANPDDLLLVDNSITKTVSLHYSNVHVIVITGGWGTGKTSTALKIYHDLKREAYVTYVAARYAVSYVERNPVRVMVSKRPSLLATLVALALTQPQELRSKIPQEFVLTNAPTVNIPVGNRELSEILDNYSKEIKGGRHVVLIDELEQVLRDEVDLLAIATCMVVLRRLFDQARPAVTLIFFVSPIRPGTRAYQFTGGTPFESRVKDLVRNVVMQTSTVDPELEFRYVMDKTLFMNIEGLEIVKEIYRGFIEKAKHLLSKHNYINAPAYLLVEDDTIEYLARIATYVRFGTDLLIDMIAESVAQGAYLSNVMKHTIMTILNIGIDPAKVLHAGKFGGIGISFDSLRKIIEGVLAELRTENKITSFTMLEERHVRGFESLTYMIQHLKGGKQHTTTISFWLRLSDLTKASSSRMSLYFKDKKVIILTTPKCKHGALASINIGLLDVVRLPNEIMYYLIARDRISDKKVLEGFENKFNEDYKPLLKEAIIKALS